jgi:peptidyl-prolyl cis-trans isomerase A (cyclophilin A)
MTFVRRLVLVSLTALLGLLPAFAAHAAGQKVRLATSLGDIVVEVDAEKAPKSAANFVQYVKAGHYDGTIFHRVIDGFMIQGGGMDRTMAEKKTRAPVPHEGREAYAKGLKNEAGTLAMARTADPNSATSQFFINVADNTRTLDPPGPNAPGYTVFGRVVSGMDVVNKIKGVQTGRSGMHGDVPVTPVVIQSATLVP